MSNTFKRSKRTHLTRKQEHKILTEVAPKIPKWKLAKFNKFLIKGVNKSSISLMKFRSMIKKDEDFEEDTATVCNVLLSSEFTPEDREVFYKELELVILKYKEND